MFILLITTFFLVYFRAWKQRQQMHQNIITAQNEKEVETYFRIAGEHLHQNVVNSRFLPHYTAIKEIEELAANSNTSKKLIVEKTQQLMTDFLETEATIRTISNNIYPPHLNYFFVETCKKHLKDLEQINPNSGHIYFKAQGSFSDLEECTALLYNLYSVMDLFAMNSLKHAKAEAIHIFLKREDNQITLEMKDNGIGFNMKTKEQDLHTRSRGLADFRGKSLILSPTYIFQSEKDKGTYYKIEFSVEKFLKSKV